MDLTKTQLAKLKNYFKGNPLYEGGIFNLYPPAAVTQKYKELGDVDLLPGEMVAPFENIRSFDEDYVQGEPPDEMYAGYTYPNIDPNIYIHGIENYGSGYGPTHEAKTLNPALARLYHTPGKIKALKESGVDTQNLLKSYLKENPGQEIWSGPSQTEKDLEIASVIGHENYHQILANNPLYAALMAKLNESDSYEHALVYGLSSQLDKTKRERERALDYFRMKHPGSPSPHEPSVNTYLENLKPVINKVIETAKNVRKVEQHTGRPMSEYRRSRPASERRYTGHGRSGMGRDPSDRMAKGGIIDKALPGRSRDI